MTTTALERLVLIAMFVQIFGTACASSKEGALAAARSVAPPRASSAPGDFETTNAHIPFGDGWKQWSDQFRGGKSSVTLRVVSRGAANSHHALRVTGTVADNPTQKWSGALYSPSRIPWQPMDLSSWTELAFWAKGDGSRYVVTLLFPGGVARSQWFTAASEWTLYRFEFRKFAGSLATNVQGLFFGTSTVGTYDFQIDQVELRAKDK